MVTKGLFSPGGRLYLISSFNWFIRQGIEPLPLQGHKIFLNFFENV